MSAELSWVRSSYSGSGGDNCVEVAPLGHAVRVRDSKDVSRTPLTYGPVAWDAFLRLVRRLP
ncbi:DUF397 domain-containing protein [Streptomyces abyssomicinicus]|uniref:DUF397 domain-containing protein n=1 Tax=Streptomyces abyssomicinicus TaxID=574929 RepID=UPI001250947B|nr:DUF397 domain-containing protein [Streptomyces abyssomicinicus]